MKIKPDLKRKSLLLIELLLAFALMGLIVGECLFFLTRATKTFHLHKKKLEQFIKKEQVALDFKKYIWHLNLENKKALKLHSNSLEINFDAGSWLNPEISGWQKGKIQLSGGCVKLFYMEDDKSFFETTLLTGVHKMKWSFYNQKIGWAQEWDSEKNGWPEMARFELETDFFSLNRQFLLPYNLEVIRCR